MNIYFVSTNRNKLKEIEEILGFKLRYINLNLSEIQAVEVEKVVEHKVKQAFKKIKKPVIVEDTGLYFDAWNGLPGALIKLFGKRIGYQNLGNLLKKNKKAIAKTVIAYFDGKNYKKFIGSIKGKISRKAKGKRNFGWDIIFIPNGYKKTFAQMTGKEKNSISMRRIALEKMKSFLEKSRRK